MTETKKLLVGALFATLACILSASGSATAAPSLGLTTPHAGTDSLVEHARYRRHYGYYRPYRPYYAYRRHHGRNVAIGVGAAIIGGIILSEAARAEYRRSGAWERCADTFRSFEPDTGMYTGYDGVRRVCPYLR